MILCNERTTCAAERHKTNFIAQPKPRHSLPRQVRALLRTMRNGSRQTLLQTFVELESPNNSLCFSVHSWLNAESGIECIEVFFRCLWIHEHVCIFGDVLQNLTGFSIS